MRNPLHILVLAPLVAGCWPFVSVDPGDDWCACSHGDTSCASYDLVATCEDDCSWTYHSCETVCRDAGFLRSAGCGWDDASYEHACLCTDDAGCDCTAGETDCWDPDTLISCDDGCYFSAWDCDTLCRDAGWDASTGCEYDFETGEDTCFCEDLPDCECSYGEVQCTGPYTLSSCDDDCWFYEYDCDALCVDAGYDYSTGCGYDHDTYEDTCFCESETPCDCSYGDVECWDFDTLASCDDGCWLYLYECHDLCVDAGYDYSTGCGYDWEGGEDTCFCESY